MMRPGLRELLEQGDAERGGSGVVRYDRRTNEWFRETPDGRVVARWREPTPCQSDRARYTAFRERQQVITFYSRNPQLLDRDVAAGVLTRRQASKISAEILVAGL